MLILGFFPFLIGCNFFSKDILSILANPETADAGYYVVSVIGAAFFFQGVTLICTQFYFVDDKIKSTLHIYLFVAFINISLNFLILEHTTSLAGPASASLISSIICRDWRLVTFTNNIIDSRSWLLLYHKFCSLCTSGCRYGIKFNFCLKPMIFGL